MPRFISLGTISSAIQSNDLFLEYQPVVQAKHPHDPVFYEALIRLQHEGYGTIYAAEFFPAISSNPRILRNVDSMALACGLNALERNTDLHLSLNMSPLSISSTQWVTTLTSWVEAHPDLAKRLILEITEHVSMGNPKNVIEFMQSLKNQGVRFALDDFGAGQTSLMYLREFAFDIVKIDGRFVQDIADNNDNQVIISALSSIARQFGMKTVAEKVRSQESLEALCDLGIDYVQGYHLQRAGSLPG